MERTIAISKSSQKRINRFVDAFIRSEYVSNWTAEKDSDFIVTGNPVDGFEFYGPFADTIHACEVGNTDAHFDGLERQPDRCPAYLQGRLESG